MTHWKRISMDKAAFFGDQLIKKNLHTPKNPFNFQ